MKLLGLIGDYSRACERLKRAIQDDDMEKIVDLDGKVQLSVNKILQFEPTNEDDQRLLVEFLLEILIECSKDGELFNQVHGKILHLATCARGT